MDIKLLYGEHHGNALLSVYLNGFQFNNPLDYRYDLFFASILNRIGTTMMIPNNINVLTWNYDIHFELTYNNYCEDLGASFRQLQSYPLIDDTPSFQINPNEFSIIHLNGSCGLYSDYQNHIHRAIAIDYS